MSKIADLFSENTVSVEIESHGQFLGKEDVRKMYQKGAGGGNRQPVAKRPQRGFAGGGTTIIQIGGVVTVAEDGMNAKGRWHTWLAESFPFGGTMGQLLAARVLRERVRQGKRQMAFQQAVLEYDILYEV
jgi:hypothetical protein